MIAASVRPSSASSPFGSTPTKASRLHPLLALVFAGLASTVATSTQAHYTLQTLAGTATEQRTEQTASGTNRLQSHSHTYKPAGSNASQTTTQDYPRDASGSLTRLGSQTLQYNAQGRIAAATTAGGSTPAYSYQYNSSAQRLLKTDLRTSTTNTGTTATATTSTEATLYADDATGSTVLGQYSNQRSTHSAAPAGETDSTEVLWLPTASGPMPIGAQINGRLYAIDSDHLNTPRRLTNAQGQVVWQWLITGYGEVAPTTGATGYAFEAPQLGASSNTSGTVYSEEVNFKLRYPGQVWDEETGLSYNLNRYYDAQAGRYIQSDPIGLDGGWNRFAYVGSNPLNQVDPTGLCVAPLVVGCAWALANAPWLVPAGVSVAEAGLMYATGASSPTSAAPAAVSAIRPTVQAARALMNSPAAEVCAAKAAANIPTVIFSRSRAPGLAQNFDNAVANGAPTQLDRVGAAARDANSRAALRGQSPAPAGQSLDEYPFACSAQGGCGSFVRAVPASEQSYQGGVLSPFFQDHGVAVGDPFNVSLDHDDQPFCGP